ncbi:MAG: thiamine phosphate synthase [Candidatus Aminicenantes bacterium]|nr:thiamine phosphate synthase [Candidatus Aminicenantes bacterium]
MFFCCLWLTLGFVARSLSSEPIGDSPMKKYFCPRCGGKLEKRAQEGRQRDFCPVCAVVHYDNPVPATAAVAFNERHELLLVKRGQEPGKGKWCLPGGFQEVGETPEQCALREFREETGLDGCVQGFIALEMGHNPQAGEVVVAGFRVQVLGGALQAGDDAVAVAYFPPGKLPDLAFQSHARIIERAAGRAWTQPRFRDLPGGAYVVTSGDHLEIAREACRGGARIVQYREKEAPAAQRLETARRIRAACCGTGTLFMVNDQLDIAILSEADGVHLGQDDVPITAARSLLPPHMLVGISCSSLAEAMEAERQGADYLGVGAIFATPVKVGYPVLGLEGLQRIAAETSLPLAAIGGVNLENMAAVKAAGAKYLAMVREFQDDTAARVAAVNAIFW